MGMTKQTLAREYGREGRGGRGRCWGEGKGEEGWREGGYLVVWMVMNSVDIGWHFCWDSMGMTKQAALAREYGKGGRGGRQEGKGKQGRGAEEGVWGRARERKGGRRRVSLHLDDDDFCGYSIAFQPGQYGDDQANFGT